VGFSDGKAGQYSERRGLFADDWMRWKAGASRLLPLMFPFLRRETMVWFTGRTSIRLMIIEGMAIIGLCRVCGASSY